MAAVNLPRRFRIELGFHNLAFLIRSPKPTLFGFTSAVRVMLIKAGVPQKNKKESEHSPKTETNAHGGGCLVTGSSMAHR